MVDQEKVRAGKKSRAAGKAFEIRVRAYLEQTGWTVDRWTNQVEFEEIPKEIKGRYSTQDIIEGKNYPQGTIRDKYGTPLKKGKLVPAKPKFIYNPQIKRRIMIGNSSGFPDFIAFKELITEAQNDHHEIILGYEIIGIESKMDGKIDKEEKEKCKWLLQNVFQKILIASKSSKRGEIILTEFKINQKEVKKMEEEKKDSKESIPDPVEDGAKDAENEIEDEESSDEDSDEDY